MLAGRGAIRLGRLSYATAAEVQKAREARMERTASDSQSFGMNLFRGQLATSQVFPYPNSLDSEAAETLRMLVDPTAKFFAEVNDSAKNDEISTIEEKSLEGLREMGAFGIQIPVEHGGLGLSNTAYARLGEIIGAHDLGIGVAMGAHQSIGLKGILLYGTPEQKAKYLPDLAAGKKFAAFCLTEPSCGSDANSIKTRAELSPDGKHYILNGSKIWITNGGIAETLTVFAQTPQTEGGVTKDKVSAFIVERAFGGVTNGAPEKKMGIKCSNTAELYFDNTKVPVENLLGKEGEGFKVAMNILNNGRFGMAAAMSGVMRHCIAQAVEHATQRTQFGRKLEEFQGIQEKLALMAMRHYVTESMAYMISANMDKGAEDYQVEAAISKIYGSESGWWVCDEAIQILGGMGFMREAGLERVLRDLRIFRIFEGTNDILRLFVALTGVQYASGPLKAAQKALKSFDVSAVMSFVGRRASRAVGTTSLSLDSQVAPELRDSAKLLCGGIEAFGGTVESLLMKEGKGIIEKQSTLSRLADASIDLYGMAAVLSRASRSASAGAPTTAHELLLTKLFCRQASERLKANLGLVQTASFAQDVELMSNVARDLCKQGGLLHINPLGF